MITAVWQFDQHLALPFFGIGTKIDLSSPVATAEFSKFAGILSAETQLHDFQTFFLVSGLSFIIVTMFLEKHFYFLILER